MLCSLMRIERDVNVLVNPCMFWNMKYDSVSVLIVDFLHVCVRMCVCVCVCQRVGCVESVGATLRNMDFIWAGPLLLTGTELEVD